VWYALGLIVVSFIFFIGIFYVDNLLFETDYEAQLRFENKSLKKHKTILTSQLGSREKTLAQLQNEDKKLYAKIFNIQVVDKEAIPETVSEDLLYTSLSSFRKSIDRVQSTSTHLQLQTRKINKQYTANPLSKEELTALSTVPSHLPVDIVYAGHLVSGFGERINPFHKGNYQHPGIDFSIPRGSAIYAAASGKITIVKQSNLQAGYGNYIEIDHGNGYVTRYAHLENSGVKVGLRVAKGDQIGTSGMSGGSISPHLHFEVILFNENIDPVMNLIQGITPDLYSALVAKAGAKNQSLD
jgi:murein DD-endopeptidase MepM/ murein hydrolase activator NlpD